MNIKVTIRILLLLLFSGLTFGQVTYQGPDTGSVPSGVLVSTNNFGRIITIGDPIERGIRNTTGPQYDESLRYLVPPSAPEGANYFEDINANISTRGSNEQTVLLQDFTGIAMGNSIPPDPIMAVGPNHILACVNSRFAIWDKQGNLLKNISADQWYASVLTNPGAFDPQIIYDHYAGRWFMLWDSQVDNPPRAHFLISISDDDDPTGIWYNYSLPANVMGNTVVNHWADYPQIGFDEEAIYINSRQFTFPSTSAAKVYDRIRILDKSVYYSATGGPVTWSDIYNISYPGDTSKPDVIHPSIMYSASSEHYFVHTVRLQGAGFITLYRITNPLTNPVLTGVNIPVTFYNPAPNANQLGGGTPLISSNESGMKSSPIYRDGYLWAVHSVRNPTSITSTSLRYYKIDVSNNTISEEITFGAADHWYLFPNLTVDKDQNIAINYTRTSLTEYASAYYTTRLATDHPGLDGSTLLKAGLGNYVVTFGGTRNRWGDYHGIYLDPLTEYNIWMFTEYAAATNIWGTWVGEIRLVPFPGIYVQTNSSSFDFGDIEVNFGSDTLKAIISNYGEDVLSISSVNDSIGPFHMITSLTYPINLSIYDSLTIELVFTPADSGDFEEFLQVTSNDSDFVGFTLKGHGYTIAAANFNQIYGSSGIQNNGEILKLDIGTGEGSLIGPSLFSEIKSISIKPQSNVVYGVVTNLIESKIVRVNAAGGDAYTVFNLPVAEMYGIAFDISGAFYGITKTGDLYKIDLTDGTASFIVSANAPVSNITFNPITNELWASAYITFGGNKDRVFKINKSTGDTTIIGNTGFSTVNYALVFDEFGNLYAVTGPTNQIYNFIQIDTLTGVGTVIGSVGYKNITGLTYLWDGVTSVKGNNISSLPEDFILQQNYPNPFNPSTTIEFSLPVSSDVKLTIYNILGEVVNILFDKQLEPGLHSVNWNSTNKSGNKMVSGVYFFELKANGVDGSEFTNLKKMILLK